MEIPRLHPDTIEQVKQRVDIVDVISEYVVLRKRGKDYLGLCPFHAEKTPSFSVSPSKQMYYCFGCAAGGNAFKFLMEVGQQSFTDAVLDLARRYQVPLKTLEPQQRQELQRQLSLREQLYEVVALAASFYQHALRQPQGESALAYLQEKRQLREETIQQFQLGYAPAGWETLYRYLVEQKRYPLDLVAQAGLIKQRQSGGGYYDRFRDRLMIPIQDTQGRIIAFGSRTLTGEEPKYLNSPETPLFNKSKTLFALDKARQSISKADRAIVVEGYFDAIALHAAGITNAVASLGTALTPEQLRLLLRYSESKQVVFNFDADRAGIEATQRAIAELEPLIYAGQVQLRVLNLPEGKDADEFLKSSASQGQEYRQLLDRASLWLDWQVQQILAGKNLQQADHFQQVVQEMFKLLQKLGNNDLRAYYLGYCAELLSQGDSRLISLYAEKLNAQLKKPQPRSAVPQSQSPTLEIPFNAERSILEQAEAALLRIYLHCPQYRAEIVAALEEKDLLFSLSHHRFLWQKIAAIQDQLTEPLKDPPDQLISRLADCLMQFPGQIEQVAHLLQLPEKTQWEDPERIPLVIRAALISLQQVAWQKYRRYCRQQWQQLDCTTEPERWQYYYQEDYQTKRKIMELESLRQFTQLEISSSVFHP